MASLATQTIEFQYITGLKRAIFRNGRLRGSWDASGRYSNDWTELPMQEDVGEDGCPMFRASVTLDLADQPRTFRWGVVLDGPQGSNFWGIPTEVQDVSSVERYRQFQLTGGRRRLNATTSLTAGGSARTNASSLAAPPEPAIFRMGAKRAPCRRGVRHGVERLHR